MGKIILPLDKKFGEWTLDLGCGDIRHRHKGYDIYLDKIDYGQGIIWNAKNGIPLPNNSCKNIVASHFMEHFREEDFLSIMNECWRIMRPDGELYIIVPSFNRDESWIPIHLLHPTIMTFKFFERYDDTAKEYRIRSWKIKELSENSRKDIHCKMIPIGIGK